MNCFIRNRNLFVFILVILMHGFLFGKVINVKDVGAKGDEKNNDTVSILKSINSLKNGDTLYFPSGNYKIDSTLVFDRSNIVVKFDKNAWLKIYGSLKKYDYDSKGSVLHFVNDSKIKFDGLQIDARNIAATGIYMWACRNVVFENATFINFMGTDEQWSNGIDLRRCYNVKVNKCLFKNILNKKKSASGILLNSDPKAADKTGICTNVYITNSHFENIKSYDDADGIKFIGRTEIPLYSNSIIKNCTFTNCYKRAIKIQNNGIKILGNRIINNRTTSEIGDHLIDIQGVDSIEIRNNNITFNKHNIAAIGFILPNKNVIIEDNNIIFNGDSGANSNYGIFTKCWVSSKPSEPPFFGENIKIKNLNISSTGDSKLKYGIYLFATTGGGNNWIIDKVTSTSPLVIKEGFENVSITNSNFPAIDDQTMQWSFDETGGKEMHSSFYHHNKGKIQQYKGKVGVIKSKQAEKKWTKGVERSAVSLESSEDYIDFHEDNLKLIPNRTLMLWMKINQAKKIGEGSHPLYPGIFSSEAKGSWDDYVSFYKDTLYNTYHIQFEDEKGLSRRSDPFKYTSGDWINVAIVMDKDSIPTFYVNGKFKGTREKSNWLNLKYLGIGYAAATDHGAFPGKIDELRIFNRALSPDAIYKYYKKVAVLNVD